MKITPGAAPGSNNWAVGPGRTASGGALIANDPHLGYALPGVWYQALLRCPTYDAAGMTLPGLPAVVLGRGPYAAWAFTSTMLDEQDLFFEELDDAGERYRRGDAWLPLEVERVAIAVRGRKPQALVLRSTDRGPLFEADPEQGLPPRSLTWASHFGGDLMSAFFVLAGARTPGEVEEGIAGYVAPAQNLVMAFADGTLYQTVIGRLPARRSGDGRLPSPGWDPAYGWDGFLPRTANPRRLFEPPTDAVLVSANNDVRPPGYAQRLPADFFPPFRADRIRERLLERRDWDFEATAELESDVTSRYARQLVAALAGAELSGDAARARDALVAWDGELARRGAAALFALVERQLQGAAFSDEARHFAVPFPGGPDPLLRLLQGRLDPAWLDDVATPDVEGRDEILERALAAAWRQGVKRWGEDVEEWDYGSLHALTLRHRLDAVPVLGRLLRRGPFPLPGSGNTVAAFGSRWQGGSLPVIYGPSMRWIVDWGLPEAARAGLPGGQSGHLADSHYDDQIEDFLAGRLHPAPWSEQAIARATVSELILLP
ncbi:MAG: penicillin acylase family protein [Acidobacteria bacterium]|nr:MAG: penicillin acylase family protein [Acidobacteriota bacterium]